MFPFTCFDIFNVEVFWPFLGQALHMFSRFPNQQIYDIFHEIFFVLFFYKIEVFYWEKNADITDIMTEKDSLQPPMKQTKVLQVW